MIFADRMKQIVAVVLDRDSEAVTRELLRLGVMHMIRATEVAAEHASVLGGVKQAVSSATIAETRKRVEGLLELLDAPPEASGGLDVDRLHAVDADAANRELERISSGVRGIRERQRALQQEILRLEEIARQVALFRDIGAGIRAGSRFSFLNIQVGSLGTDKLESFAAALRQWPSVQINLEADGDRTRLLVITLRRDEGQIDAGPRPARVAGRRALRRRLGPQEAGAGGGRRPPGRPAARPGGVHGGDPDAARRRARAACEELWANLRMTELHHRIQSYFSTTVRTVLFSGWVPASMQRSLESAVRRAAGGMCLIEWHDPRAGESAAVPVRLHNPKFLAPFQMLVQNYATPSYGTVDPTPFVAVTYLIMFGLMFGDAGQGAILVLASVLGLALYKEAADGVRNLLRLGALLRRRGHGDRDPLRLDVRLSVAATPSGSTTTRSSRGTRTHSGFVRDVYGVLAITLYFGIAVIALGLLLNWVNLVVTRRWVDLFLSKGGVIGSWLYGAGVYAAFGFAASGYRVLPPADRLFWMFGVPALLLMAGPPIHFFSDHRAPQVRAPHRDRPGHGVGRRDAGDLQRVPGQHPLVHAGGRPGHRPLQPDDCVLRDRASGRLREAPGAPGRGWSSCSATSW